MNVAATVTPGNSYIQQAVKPKPRKSRTAVVGTPVRRSSRILAKNSGPSVFPTPASHLPGLQSPLKITIRTDPAGPGANTATVSTSSPGPGGNPATVSTSSPGPGGNTASGNVSSSTSQNTKM